MLLSQQVYRQERVFISHAGPQKHFALHLRTQLRNAGVSTFVDERELLPGAQHTAAAVMQAACEQAQLVVFLITRDFLRRTATVQELRWVLAQRQKQLQTGLAADRALPQLLTVLYPTSVCPSWRAPAELQHVLDSGRQAAEPLPGCWPCSRVRNRAGAANMVQNALNDAPVDVSELQNGSLATLLRFYHPGGDVELIMADLATLAQPSVIRLDSVPRCHELP
jgi:TIR domain